MKTPVLMPARLYNGNDADPGLTLVLRFNQTGRCCLSGMLGLVPVIHSHRNSLRLRFLSGLVKPGP